MTLIYMVQLAQMLAFLKTFTLTLQLRFLVGWVKKCWPISYLSGHSCANTKTKGFTEEIASTTQFCVGHFFKYRQKTKGFSEVSTCTMHLPPPYKQLHRYHTPMLVQNRLWQLGQHSHPGKKHSHLRQKLEIHFKGNYFPGHFLAGTYLSVCHYPPSL